MTPSRYLAEAEAELEKQYDDYDEVDLDLADDFVDAVEEAAQYIRDFPGIGPPLERGYHKRVLRKPFRYQLVYKEHDGILLIVAVWADRRDPAKLLARLDRVDRDLDT